MRVQLTEAEIAAVRSVRSMLWVGSSSHAAISAMMDRAAQEGWQVFISTDEADALSRSIADYYRSTPGYTEIAGLLARAGFTPPPPRVVPTGAVPRRRAPAPKTYRPSTLRARKGRTASR